MGAIRNHIRGLALAGMIAATLVINATPAAADQAVTVTVNGSRACIILTGVLSNANDLVASIIGAVLEKLGC